MSQLCVTLILQYEFRIYGLKLFSNICLYCEHCHKINFNTKLPYINITLKKKGIKLQTFEMIDSLHISQEYVSMNFLKRGLISSFKAQKIIFL